MPENVNTTVLEINEPSEVEDDRPTMIKVDHVSMVFNKASEQLNSLKEYAIKLAKRELFFEGFKALDDVSFEVKKGDVFGIMGTNGSGKSTMLKIIAGVLEPSSGTCEINGNIAPLIELGAGFDMELTARENIYLNGALLGYSKEFINDHFDEIVDFAEIESFLDMPLKNYSSGMVARIAFAIATVIVPEILLVDEVLSVGDFMFQKKCEDRINELIEKHGVTVLIVSHSNEQIARLCNKAIWIEKGHTRLLGDASMVTRVYGGLGGRTGSVEAEKHVFRALVESTNADSMHSVESVMAENPSALSMRLIETAWRKEDIQAIALACDGTHMNAVVANAFASAFGAPIASVSPERISDSVQKLLYASRPKKIFIFDFGGYAEEIEDELQRLSWAPEVCRFGEKGQSYLEYSSAVMREGSRLGLWGGRLSIVHFDDNLSSLAFSPYLYRMRCPILFFDAAHDCIEDVRACLRECEIEEIISIGTDSRRITAEMLGYQGAFTEIGSEDEGEACLKIAQFVCDSLSVNEDALRAICIAPLNLSQWPALLSVGCFAVKANAILFLVADNRLEDVSASIGFIRNNKANFIKLINIGVGSSGLSLTTCELLAWSLRGDVR